MTAQTPSPRPGAGTSPGAAAGSESGSGKSRLRLVAFRAGGVLVGLLMGVLLIEVVLRAAGIEPPRQLTKRLLVDESDPSVAYHCYPSNPHGEFQPVPAVDEETWRLWTYTFEPRELPLEKLDETPWCVEYEYSSKSIRDREYPPEPPPGVLRIAGIGDSFVFGEGVPMERTLFRQVESLLGDGYEIINGGQVGADTEQELQILSKITTEANCPRAIFVFIPNDIGLTFELDERQEYINDLILVRDQYLEDYESRAWYAGHLRVLHFVGGYVAMQRITRETIQWYLDCYDPRYNAENLEALEQNIRSLAEIPDCRVAFVLYPLMEGFETGYPLQAIHERVAAMAREARLPVLDLAPAFEGEQTRSLWVHPSDHHPNGRAHAIAAQAIAEWLQRDVPDFLEHQ